MLEYTVLELRKRMWARHATGQFIHRSPMIQNTRKEEDKKRILRKICMKRIGRGKVIKEGGQEGNPS